MDKDQYNNYYNKYLKEFAKENRKHSTFAEFLLWHEILKGRKLGYQFLRQRPVSDYIGDFFCKELMLFIETDGITHELNEVKKKDKEKEADIISKGYTIIRFKDNDVAADVDGIRTQIDEWIKDYEVEHPEVVKYKSRGKWKFRRTFKKSSP